MLVRAPIRRGMILVIVSAFALLSLGMSHGAARELLEVRYSQALAMGYTLADICGEEVADGADCPACRLTAAMVLPDTITIQRPLGASYRMHRPLGDRVIVQRRLHPTPPSRGPPVAV